MCCWICVSILIFQIFSDYCFLSNFAASVPISTLNWGNIFLRINGVSSLILLPVTPKNCGKTRSNYYSLNFILDWGLNNSHSTILSSINHLIIRLNHWAWNWTCHMNDVLDALDCPDQGLVVVEVSLHELNAAEGLLPELLAQGLQLGFVGQRPHWGPDLVLSPRILKEHFANPRSNVPSYPGD